MTNEANYLKNIVGDGNMKFICTPIKTEILIKAIEAIEEVEKHKETFEWCTDCKEYDHEEHCCHRWTKQIRDTLEEQKQAISDKTSDKYRWHDLRKNPEDLPINLHTVLICLNGFEGRALGVTMAMHDSTSKLWGSAIANFKDYEVIAWREIEPFKDE